MMKANRDLLGIGALCLYSGIMLRILMTGNTLTLYLIQHAAMILLLLAIGAIALPKDQISDPLPRRALSALLLGHLLYVAVATIGAPLPLDFENTLALCSMFCQGVLVLFVAAAMLSRFLDRPSARKPPQD